MKNIRYNIRFDQYMVKKNKDGSISIVLTENNKDKSGVQSV